MKLLHIIDDKKFVQFCKNTFEIDFVQNYYLKSGEISVDYLEKNKIDLIFIHYLNDKEINFLYMNNIKTPKIWMFWGADGFSLPLFYNKFLDKHSQRVSEKIKFKNGFKDYIKHKVKLCLNNFWNNSKMTKRKINVINQMDYIVPIVPGDFRLLKEFYDIKPKLWHFNYVTDLLGTFNEEAKGNILLGNSSSLTNNHFSILETLNKMELGERKVYVPLSYGNEQYKKFILSFIGNLDNPNIIPLNDFMSYEDYTAIINSCDVMIMNHQRQQALGNVILGLLNGCTVFMDESSTLYKFLIENEILIKSCGEIKGMNTLTLEEKIHNSNLAKKLFGKDKQIESVKKLLDVFK